MSTESAGPRPPVPDYGIIFNNDGGYLKHAEFPMSVEDLLERIYGPLTGTQVGALTWCVGVEEAHWPSARLSMIGEAEGRRYFFGRDMRRAESLRAMFDADVDLYGQLVRRGHQMGLGVYASVRMNDNHFWSDAERRVKPLRPEEMAATERPHLTAFRKRHPEWVLDEGAPAWAATSWNMAVPEVREYTLQRIAEACKLADWDGVELDWQRHAFHLPEEDAYRLRYTLTDLQCAVRRLTDAIAEQRGRPFHVIVRVGASRETNRRVGYDLEAWTEEGLCDIVVTGANSGTDPGVEVEAYVEMMRGTQVRLYPGFDSHGEWGRGHLLPAERWRESWFRGLATGFYERGATGVHLFNWHNHVHAVRPLLQSLGAPDSLRRTAKVYAAVKRHIRDRSELRYGAERDDRLRGEVPVDLLRTLVGGGPRFHIGVYEDVSEDAALELQIDLDHLSPRDRVSVKLDGQRLGNPMRRSPAAEAAANPADVSENTWLVWPLVPAQVGKGVHIVGIDLLERDPRLRPPIAVRNVEIHVSYRNGGNTSAEGID